MYVNDPKVEATLLAFETGKRLASDDPEASSDAPRAKPTLTPAEVAVELRRDWWREVMESTPGSPA